MLGLLGSFALRSEPVPAAAAESQFDLTWNDLTDLHRADREKLPMPEPVKPRFEPAFEPKPVPPPPPIQNVPTRTAEAAPAQKHKPEYNSCTRRGMHRVYHHGKYWCKR